MNEALKDRDSLEQNNRETTQTQNDNNSITNK